ncbi:MAG: hypothetical protein AB7V45_13395 [Candidatus Krumholzibacteriia bacterium]
MANQTRIPVHVWIVGVVTLLWNLMGAYDYLMTQTRNEAYMAKFTPEQLDYFYGFPVWVEAFWALAVWGSLLGSVLILLRKGLAAPVLLVSFVCMVVTAIYNFGLSDGMKIMGTGGFVFTVVIFLVALGLWLYARAMKRRGVLA